MVLRGNATNPQVRREALRALLAGLLGLMHSAGAHETSAMDKRKRSGSVSRHTSSPSVEAAAKDAGIDVGASRRTRISPDIWHDTLSLLCDKEFAVRVDYARALSFYIANEMPKHPEMYDGGGHNRLSIQETITKSALIHAGGVGTKFLDALHAYVYTLATTSSLGLSLTSSPSHSLHTSPNSDAAKNQVNLDDRTDSPTNGGAGDKSMLANIHAPRGRKVSLAFRLLDKASRGASASPSDYGSILDVLATVHGQLPIRGLLSGVPMLLALDAASRKEDDDPACIRRMNTIKLILAKIWLLLGSQWNSPDLVDLAENVRSFYVLY